MQAASLIGVTAPTPGATYYYAVKAVSLSNSGGEVSSPVSNVASVNTGIAPTSAPAAPDELAATSVTADHVTLTWRDNSLTETRFDIYRREAGTTDWGTPVGSVTADITTFTDTSVLPSASYEYAIAAHNETGDGLSAPLAVATLPAGPAPDAPTGLAVDPAQTTSGQIALTWIAPAAVTVTGYDVYRQNADGTWLRLNAGPVAGTQYIDGSLDAGTSYNYRVTAVSDENSQSAPAALSASTLAGPPVVRIVAPMAYAGFSVNWTDPGATPVDGRITKLTPVMVVVDDADHATLSWSLQLQPAGAVGTTATAAILLASGTGPLGSALDPTGARAFALDPAPRSLSRSSVSPRRTTSFISLLTRA
jgi:hypothetical protein